MQPSPRCLLAALSLLTACGRTATDLGVDGATGAPAGGTAGAIAAGGGPAAGGSAGTAGNAGTAGSAGAAGDDRPWTNGIAPLHTDGRFLKDPDGNVVVLRGVAIADPRDLNQRDSGVDAPALIERLGDAAAGFFARVIRITVFPEIWLADPEGYFTDHLRPAVERATARGLYVIVDWHEISDVEPVAARTAEFWRFMAPQYAGQTNVLYEIFNEPMDTANPSWDRWQAFAQPWIDQIRRDAPHNVILVGGPFWSQQIGDAAADPFSGANLAYVGHVYPVSAATLLLDGSPIAQAASARPVMLTEWGYRDTGDPVWGGSRTSFGEPLKRFVEAHGLSWTAWCADTIWEPVMFDMDWQLMTGDANMGGFVRDWLAERQDQDQPVRR